MKYLICIFLLSITIVSCSNNNEKLVDQVKRFSSLPGNQYLDVYYTDGYEDKAKAMAELLSEAIHFFEAIKQAENYTLAVLDKDDFDQLKLMHQHPYGMPFISDGVIIMPASKGVVYQQLIQLFEQNSNHLADNMKRFPAGQLVSSSIDLIVLHELGHSYQDVFISDNNVKWLNEFMANFLMIYFLDKNYPLLQDQIITFCEINSQLIKPSYHTLEEFEKFYARDPATYSWYQSKLTLMAYQVYREQGISYLYQLKKGTISVNEISNLWVTK